jgi:hypothetical protein
MTLRVSVNADSLYPFSIAKDLLTLVPVDHWFLPGPLFIVPDILISIPLVAIFKTPALWACAFSAVQLFAFVTLIAYFAQSKNQLSFLTRLIYSIYLTAATCIVGLIIFHSPWIFTAGQAFVAVSHASAGLCALLVFFLMDPRHFYLASIKKITVIIFLVFVFSLSDLFFCLYLFCLNLPYLFIYRTVLFKKRRWFFTMSCIAIVGSLGVLLDTTLNAGFKTELAPYSFTSFSALVRNIAVFWHASGWYGTLLLFVTPVIFLCYAFLQKKNYLAPFICGMWLISLICLLLGLFNADPATLRYSGIYFPMIVYVLFELLPLKCFKWLNTFFVSIVLIAVGALYAQQHFKHYNTAIFQSSSQPVLSCPDFQKNASNAVLVATYWPAKVLFESTDRKASLLQVAPNLATPYNWIVNPAWQHMVKNPKNALISTYQLDPSVMHSLLKLPNAHALCRGQLIKVSLDNALFKLAPVLLKYRS